MRVAVPKEIKAGEKRVALVPDIINKLTRLGLDVVIESGAGTHSQATDADFTTAGATVKQGDVLSDADVVLSVQPLTAQQMATLKKGAITISFLSPVTAVDSIEAAAAAGVTAFSLELVPRISRAQSMDALTSQALCAGYRAAVVGAELSPRFFPMLMTAAGTVTPAQVLVLGAGVAGLQAIATARRLGAIVEAYDVRSATKEQVQSLGAKFIDMQMSADSAGGYARELTEAEKAQQQEILARHVAKADAIITTAAIPGRPSPKIITEAMITAMKPGAVIVDIAAEGGGNTALTRLGEVVDHNGVKIFGPENLPSQLAAHASEMYSKNLLNFLTLLVNKEGAIQLDWSDQILADSVLTNEGQIRHTATRERIEKNA